MTQETTAQNATESTAIAVTAANDLMNVLNDWQGHLAHAYTEALESMLDDDWSKACDSYIGLARDTVHRTALWQIEAMSSAAKTVNGSCFGSLPVTQEASRKFDDFVDMAAAEQRKAVDGMVDMMMAPFAQSNEWAVEYLVQTRKLSQKYLKPEPKAIPAPAKKRAAKTKQAA